MKSVNGALRAALVSFLVVTAAPSPPAFGGEPTAPIEVGILGDSLSTGAATHPALRFDSVDLWAVFDGQRSVAPVAADLPEDFRGVVATPLLPPVRLWPSPREFLGGPDWVWRNALGSLSRAFLDTEEYSWGYLVGAGLKVAPARVAIAGEDGARVAAIPRQVDRLLDANSGKLPRRTFMLYTGNDLCGQTMELTTTPEDFADGLKTGLRYALVNGAPAGPEGSDIYVLSYLGVLQLLHDDVILNKQVYAYGKQLTCRELRAQGFTQPDEGNAGGTTSARVEAAGVPPWFAWFMPPNPSAFCPTLFGGAEGVEGKSTEAVIGALANRIRAYREEEERVVAAVADETLKLAKPGEPSTLAPVRVHYLKSSGTVSFAAEDIAGDCFHLSASGQAKIARAALKDLEAL